MDLATDDADSCSSSSALVADPSTNSTIQSMNVEIVNERTTKTFKLNRYQSKVTQQTKGDVFRYDALLNSLKEFNQKRGNKKKNSPFLATILQVSSEVS